jgi:hypothetical protein
MRAVARLTELGIEICGVQPTNREQSHWVVFITPNIWLEVMFGSPCKYRLMAKGKTTRSYVELAAPTDLDSVINRLLEVLAPISIPTQTRSHAELLLAA